MNGLRATLSSWLAGAALALTFAVPAAAQTAGGAVSPSPTLPQPPAATAAQSALPGATGATLDAGGFEGFGSQLPEDVIIQYDPETGRIFALTDPQTAAAIEQIIQSMDRPIPQVWIKVLFLEVTHSNDIDLGAEFSFTYGQSDQLDSIATNFGVGAQAFGGFWRVVDEQFQSTLRALETEGKLEVLSRPSVLARNNETAIITIGQEVPFIRNTRITDNGQQINTIEYDDIGIILEVTPRITEQGLVEMYVYPEISTLTGDTVPVSDTVNARVIAKRAAETSVVVGDGMTVVIGGLMEDNVTQTVSKIPILGDIPLLGTLFRRTIDEKVKTELLIFLTPYVVQHPLDLQRFAVDELGRAELPHRVFTREQYNKFVDNIGQRPLNEWQTR